MLKSKLENILSNTFSPEQLLLSRLIPFQILHLF